MHIVLFGSGSPLSLAALAALRTKHQIAAAVLPRNANVRTNAFARAARDHCPVLRFDASLAAHLREIAPDLLCVATFPEKITSEHLASAKYGGLNLHTSLLPRHRGPDPLFWTYFHDDQTTGVTVHAISDQIDSGDIFAQASIPLRRGRPVVDLYKDLSFLGGETLLSVVNALEAGTATARPQGTVDVSVDPRPVAGSFSIPLDEWGAERLWHFLSGIAERRGDLLTVVHGPALGFRLERPARPPGSIVRSDGRLRVYCHDGFVDVSLPSVRRRLHALLLRVREALRRRRPRRTTRYE